MPYSYRPMEVAANARHCVARDLRVGDGNVAARGRVGLSRPFPSTNTGLIGISCVHRIRGKYYIFSRCTIGPGHGS